MPLGDIWPPVEVVLVHNHLVWRVQGEEEEREEGEGGGRVYQSVEVLLVLHPVTVLQPGLLLPLHPHTDGAVGGGAEHQVPGQKGWDELRD